MVQDHGPKNSDSHVLRKHDKSDEVHCLANPLLDPLLNVELLLLGEISLGVATAGAVVGHGQLVVVLASPVRHQVGIVGGGGVGHRPTREMNFLLTKGASISTTAHRYKECVPRQSQNKWLVVSCSPLGRRLYSYLLVGETTC